MSSVPLRYVPLVEFMYLVFTGMPGESYRRRLRSLLLYLCYVFCVDSVRALWASFCKKKKKTGLNVHIRLIKDGEKGGGGWKGVWRWGKREIIYLLLHCHHQNGSCIKMGSDESHFNVSVGSDGQSHKTVSTNHNLFEENGEPKRYRTEVLPLTSLTPYR